MDRVTSNCFPNLPTDTTTLLHEVHVQYIFNLRNQTPKNPKSIMTWMITHSQPPHEFIQRGLSYHIYASDRLITLFLHLVYFVSHRPKKKIFYGLFRPLIFPPPTTEKKGLAINYCLVVHDNHDNWSNMIIFRGDLYPEDNDIKLYAIELVKVVKQLMPNIWNLNHFSSSLLSIHNILLNKLTPSWYVSNSYLEIVIWQMVL